MNVESKFYVESPFGEYWTTIFPKVVIEGEDIPQHPGERLPQRIKVLGPSSFSKIFLVIPKNLLIECSGPGRTLEFEEYVELVHKLKPDLPLPKTPSSPLPKETKTKSSEIFQSSIENKVKEEQKFSIAILKNGTVAPKYDALATLLNLKNVKKKSYLAFFDLVKKCRNSSHEFTKNPFGDSIAILKRWALLRNDETVHDIVKNVVLSAVTGEGADMLIQSPFKE